MREVMSAFLLSMIVGAAQAQGVGTPMVPNTPPAFQNVINVTQQGVSASASDNATALQAAINLAVAQGKPLYVPSASSCYKYTAPLTISGNLSIIGDFAPENWGVSSFNAASVPTGSPPISGSVLCPTSNGFDAIDITGIGPTVNISNIGILFQTPFSGTGHGINASPPYTSAADEQGLSGSNWTNVKVYGHDGNHYAFQIINPFYNGFYELRSYGGGGYNIIGKTFTSILYGNSVFYDPYVFDLVGGSAASCRLTGSAAGNLQLITFIRPQCWLGNLAGITPGGNPPTSAQFMWTSDANVTQVRVVSPDFESNVGGVNNYGSASNDFGLPWGQIGIGQNGNLSSGVSGINSFIFGQSAFAGTANGGSVTVQPGALSGAGVNGLLVVKAQGTAGNTVQSLQTPSATPNEAAFVQYQYGASIEFETGFLASSPLEYFMFDNSTSTNFLVMPQGGPLELQPTSGNTQIGSSTGSIFLNGKTAIGSASLTVPVGGLGFAKITADAAAPGAAGGKIELVCGTNAGSAKLIAYAGTSTTPVTVLDNIGTGVTGC